jgi:hypothetical protein
MNVVRLPGVRMPPGSRAVLVDLARRLDPADLCVQLVLADDACLRRLNRQYRGRNRTTDVLSFLYGRATLRPRHFRANGQAQRLDPDDVEHAPARHGCRRPGCGAVRRWRAAAQAQYGTRCVAELMLLALRDAAPPGSSKTRHTPDRKTEAHLRWLARRRTGWALAARARKGAEKRDALVRCRCPSSAGALTFYGAALAALAAFGRRLENRQRSDEVRAHHLHLA